MPVNYSYPLLSMPTQEATPAAGMATKRASAAVDNINTTRHEGNQIDPAASVEDRARRVTPPSSGKLIPSSPLLPFHHESVQLQNNGPAEVASRRVSQLVNIPRNDPSKLEYSPREIKRLIGPWNLGKTLGVGSTGRVRKARHILTGQIAAVKIMSKAEAASMRSTSVMHMDTMLAPGARKTRENNVLPFGLEREIVIMKIIDHANIIKLFDLWENRGEIYLVLEYVEGGELFNYIVRQGGLDERESFRIFRQIMSAVSYCHMFRVCHRDIKPENILMDSVGNIKLADFGMASREHIGGLNTSCGSPHYAPPEIAYGEAYIGSQVDIWSAGAVLYVMLTGNLPFGNNCDPYDIEAVLTEITTTEPEYGSNISDLAYDLLVRMLLKNPSGRIAAEDVWRHPLIKHYDEVAKTASDPHRWIGGPPKPLTTDDCGKPMTRADVDRDLLNSLCTLWHLVDPEEMMQKLTEERPNYEKVIYRNLYQFRKEQEENYSGSGLEHADSDVHHLQRRPIRTQSRMTVFSGHKRLSSVSSVKSQSAAIRPPGPRVSFGNLPVRADMLGAKRGQEVEQHRHSSVQQNSDTKFTVAGPHAPVKVPQESVEESSRSSRQPSQKSQVTEKSYDPFRASSNAKPPVEADHAKVTVLGNDSVSSRYGYVTYAASLRRPASERLKSDGPSMRSSPRPSAKGNHGKKKLSYRASGLRYSSSGSWASTHMSGSSARQFTVSAVKSRRVIRVVSAKRPTPPSRPRNPTPLSKKQGCVDNAYAGRKVSSSPEPSVFIKKESPSSESEDRAMRGLSIVPPDDSQRTSTLWEERTRQASVELSELMDEVFCHDQLSSVLWDDATEQEKQEEFVRRSFDLPGLRGTGYSRHSPEVINKKPEAPPPCENPAKLRSIYDADSIAELTKVKESLEKRAKDLGTHALDPVIGHLGRLLGGPVPVSRRISSAPGPSRQRHRVGSLSPVREEEEGDEPRHVSNPVKGKYGSLFGNRSTIRLVNHSEASLLPAPLKIKKKASIPFFGSSSNKETIASNQGGYQSRDQVNAGGSATTLEKLFRRHRSDSHTSNDSVVHHPTAYANIGVAGSSEASDSQHGKNWFRRSHMPVQPSPLTQGFDLNPGMVNAGYNGSSSNTTSDELPFRLPKPESTASKVVRFFTRQPKEKRMQIALPDDDIDWYRSQSPDSNPYETSSSQSFVSRAGAREVANRLSHVGGPMASDRRRFSSFAQSSSPHLFSTLLTTQPQFQSTAPTNLFARLFNISARPTAPVPHLICLHLPRVNAINEIRLVLRDWRQYGLCNVRVHKKSGTVHATVSENNTFAMLPVSIVAAVHAVAVDGNAGGLSIVKITSEWGNRTSFSRACESLDGVLRGRNLVVREKHVVSEMKRALRDWERM